MKIVIHIILLVFLYNVYSVSAQCDSGMSSTESGCYCSAGYVNRTDEVPGCIACPAGTHATAINENTVIADDIMIDMIISYTRKNVATMMIPFISSMTDNLTDTGAEQAFIDSMIANLTYEMRQTLFFDLFTSTDICVACETDHYSDISATTCLECGRNSSSVGGSGACHCDAGFDHNTGGVCTPCVACTTELKFDVTLAMAQDDFVGDIRDTYKTAVAKSLAVPISSVGIGDVRMKPTIRRLLSTDPNIIVPTTVLVSTRYVDSVLQLIDTDMIPTLSLIGITAMTIGPVTTTPVIATIDKTEFPSWFVISLASVGLVFLIGMAVICIRVALMHKTTKSDYIDTNAATFNTDGSEGCNTSLLNTGKNEVYNTSLQIDGFMQDLHLNHNQPGGGLKGVSVSLPHPGFWR
jgi:hypothetical protein